MGSKTFRGQFNDRTFHILEFHFCCPMQVARIGLIDRMVFKPTRSQRFPGDFSGPTVSHFFTGTVGPVQTMGQPHSICGKGVRRPCRSASSTRSNTCRRSLPQVALDLWLLSRHPGDRPQITTHKGLVLNGPHVPEISASICIFTKELARTRWALWVSRSHFANNSRWAPGR